MKGLTNNEFLQRIKPIHPELKVMEEYRLSNIPVTVQDEDGILYKAIPDSLFVGKKPSIHTAINKTEAFKIKLKKIQPNLEVIGEYIDNKIKILIKDSLGIEYLSKPSNLLNGKTPSLQTAKNKELALLIKIKDKLPNIKIVGSYIGKDEKILVEDELGIQYLTIPNNLLKGRTPSILSAIDKNKAFAIKASKIHDNKYDYSKSIYKNDSSKIKIKCPYHGYFHQYTTNHLMGHGCNKCVCEIRLGGWTKSDWVNICNSNSKCKPKFYVIHCFNDKEQFIKIGITGKEINERFVKSNLPYDYVIVKSISGDAGFVYDKEKEFKKQYKSFRYMPKLDFGGKTECYLAYCKDLILKNIA